MGKIINYFIVAAVSKPKANEQGNSLIGRTHFLRNTRDCGQKCRELWLCMNREIKMRGMILLHRRLEPTLFFINILLLVSSDCHATKNNFEIVL